MTKSLFKLQKIGHSFRPAIWYLCHKASDKQTRLLSRDCTVYADSLVLDNFYIFLNAEHEHTVAGKGRKMWTKHFKSVVIASDENHNIYLLFSRKAVKVFHTNCFCPNNSIFLTFVWTGHYHQINPFEKHLKTLYRIYISNVKFQRQVKRYGS